MEKGKAVFRIRKVFKMRSASELRSDRAWGVLGVGTYARRGTPN
jgi:hypothetical protein